MSYPESMEGPLGSTNNQEALTPQSERERKLVEAAEVRAARAMAFTFADKFRNLLAQAHGNAELLRIDADDPNNETINSLQQSLGQASETIHDATRIQRIVYAKAVEGLPGRLDLNASLQPLVTSDTNRK